MLLTISSCLFYASTACILKSNMPTFLFSLFHQRNPDAFLSSVIMRASHTYEYALQVGYVGK